MWGLGKCVCSLKIKLRVYSCELDGFWVLLLYGLITNWKQARLTLPRPIPNSEHVYASLTDTCGPRQSSDRLNTSEIKNEEHKSFTRTWKVVVFWVRRRTRTDQRKVWHRNRTQEIKIGRAIAAWCRWPAAGVFVCVRADRSVEGAWLINYLQQVRFGLPAALQSLLRFGRTQFSVCWWVCSLIAQPVRSPESQIIHPQVSRSLLAPAASAQRLLTAWAAAFFYSAVCWLVGFWLCVAWEQTSVITSSETPSTLVLFSGNMRF